MYYRIKCDDCGIDYVSQTRCRGCNCNDSYKTIGKALTNKQMFKHTAEQSKLKKTCSHDNIELGGSHHQTTKEVCIDCGMERKYIQKIFPDVNYWADWE